MRGEPMPPSEHDTLSSLILQRSRLRARVSMVTAPYVFPRRMLLQRYYWALAAARPHPAVQSLVPQLVTRTISAFGPRPCACIGSVAPCSQFSTTQCTSQLGCGVSTCAAGPSVTGNLNDTNNYVMGAGFSGYGFCFIAPSNGSPGPACNVSGTTAVCSAGSIGGDYTLRIRCRNRRQSNQSVVDGGADAPADPLAIKVNSITVALLIQVRPRSGCRSVQTTRRRPTIVSTLLA